MKKNEATLDFHISQVKEGKRRFENVYQAVSRMILDGKDKVERVTVNSRTTYDFKVFRGAKKHIIGMYDELNSFVS